MKTNDQMDIKSMVKGIYDVQKLRIASGQRILAQTLVKLGLPPEIPESENETKAEKATRLKLKKERDEIISSFLSKLGISEATAEEAAASSTKGSKKKQTDFLLKSSDNDTKKAELMISIGVIFSLIFCIILAVYIHSAIFTIIMALWIAQSCFEANQILPYLKEKKESFFLNSVSYRVFSKLIDGFIYGYIIYFTIINW
jgi:hypothetical protein